MGVSYANGDVLDFYIKLPFNYYGSAETAAGRIRKSNPLRSYPALVSLLNPELRTLDVGCGAGWVVNAMNYHHRTRATGIDFNPVALDQARQVAAYLGLESSFVETDLFTYIAETPFEVVTSLGVLHHTDNCMEALRHICRRFVKPGGHIFIGLYHAHGRKPFLDHFANLRGRGLAEEHLFQEYRSLHPVSSDETFLRSWFRDQVLHPHETQHTLKEIVQVIREEQFDLISTSINGFEPYCDLDDLYRRELEMEKTAVAKLRAREYYPGFFLFLARRSNSHGREA